MEPEIVADYRNLVGEGPLWHPEEKRLYWVDILGGKIFRFDPATGKHEIFWQGNVTGGFTFQADGSLLLFMERGAVAVLRNDRLSYLIDELPGQRENRFNDVITDPAGRVFCGTMPLDDRRAVNGERVGTMYRLDTTAQSLPCSVDAVYPTVWRSLPTAGTCSTLTQWTIPSTCSITTSDQEKSPTNVHSFRWGPKTASQTFYRVVVESHHKMTVFRNHLTGQWYREHLP